MDFDVTESPQDLVAALSLSRGTTYAVQNVSPDARVFVRVQATAPARTDRAFVIRPFEFHYPQAGTGEGIFVWSPEGAAAVVVAEAS